MGGLLLAENLLFGHVSVNSRMPDSVELSTGTRYVCVQAPIFICIALSISRKIVQFGLKYMFPLDKS